MATHLTTHIWSSIVLIGILSACGGGGSSNRGSVPPPVQPPAQPASFHCANDNTCPQIAIDGDPVATDTFRGLGDPSLEYDSDTATLWMSYSWLDVIATDPVDPALINFGIRTHLATSSDEGRTFQFVRAINAAAAESHPETAQSGFSTHEVSTLVKGPLGQWQLLWLRYFSFAAGTGDRSDFRYQRTVANDPTDLGDAQEDWIRGTALSPSISAPHNLSLIPELADCTIYTEPALYATGTATYLATHCIVINAQAQRDQSAERLVLLREESNGYTYLGELLSAADAADLNADTLEQADISLARDGSLLLIVTPIDDDAVPPHQGCTVFEIEDLEVAKVKRDTSGKADPRAIITGDGSGLGPGLCTYDAASETGVILVIPTLSTNPFEATFSMRATGFHP